MKYIANPVEVEADKIIKVVSQATSEHPMILQLEGGELYSPNASLLARMTPAVGDYVVTQSDGYIYLNPKDVFERKYRPISGAPELNALELGAAVRRAGLAGQ